MALDENGQESASQASVDPMENTFVTYEKLLCDFYKRGENMKTLSRRFLSLKELINKSYIKKQQSNAILKEVNSMVELHSSSRQSNNQ